MTALYKVLGPNGEAFHGGSGTWPLPKGKRPAAWMRVDGEIEVCQRGLHLTDKPIRWWKPGARLFEVEIEEGARTAGDLASDDHKIAVSAARLVREVDWGEHCVWIDSEHKVGEGEALAYGNATVRAYGSTTVEAYGSATVRAYDNATVEAHDRATVRAYDNATVEAYDRANVISTEWHSPAAVVALSNLAAHIDRRNGKVELRKAQP